MTKTPQQILLDAADLLETKGWTQRAYARGKSGRAVNEKGRSAVCFCTVGAIRRVASSVSEEIKAETLLKTRVGWAVLDWNDAEDQTAENVIKTMREAAHEA